MSEPISFPEWLRRRRRALGLTQHALAARVPCSPSLLRKYEAGERRPSRQAAGRLAEVLGIPGAQREAFIGLAVLGAPAGPAPSAAPEPYPGALPIPPAPLFGRERAAEVAARLVLGHPGRLVTLVGPPGVGKTRLAVRVAADLRPAFDAGVCFVALGPLAAPGLLAEALAQALGVREGGRSPAAAAIGFLRPRHLLLVLDNFEHLLDAAPLAAELLSVCPRLHILATSREALRLRAERRFPVAPLALPAGPAEAAASPAVQLFAERAQAVAPEFALGPAEAPAAAAICARLDGLPLAIELAAGRSDELAPAALLALLDRRLPLLVGGPRDLPAHQQTLRATLDWSYRRLGRAEAGLFALLGVFADGPTLDAVAAVAELAPREAERLLEALGRKNLVRRLHQAAGPPRFALLETLREYALERLEEAGGAAAARARLAAHFVALGEAIVAELPGPDGHGHMLRLDGDLNNLRAALTWSVDHDGGAAVARLMVSLEHFWTQRGHWRLVEQYGAPALERAAGLPPALLARALQVVGYILSQHSPDVATTARAIACFERSLELARAAGAAAIAVRALNFLAMTSRYPGNAGRTGALLDESLGLQRALGEEDPGTYNQLGMLRTQQGDYAGAAAALERGLALAEATGRTLAALSLMISLADALRRAGRGREARAHLAAVAEQARLRDAAGLGAHARLGLGLVAAAEGELGAAAGHAAAAVARFRELRARSLLAAGLCLQAQITLLAGDDGAGPLAGEALIHSCATFYIEVAAHALAAAAAAAAGRRDDERAAALLGAADGLVARFGLPAEPLDRRARALVEPARARLGAVAFGRLRAAAEGRLTARVPAVAFASSAAAMAAIDLERLVAAAAGPLEQLL